jgi:DNA polymerase delta subunit 2
MPEKYFSNIEENEIMLEDDSGRIRLSGDLLKSVNLVTGCIVAVMGTENPNGELEIIDVKLPDLAPQPERWSLIKPSNDKAKLKSEDGDEEMENVSPSGGKKLAIVSGLSFSSSDASYALELNLLLEYLLGEALGPAAQTEISQISRLIVAGNSISTAKTEHEEITEKKINKKYGYDASAYNALPSQLFDDFLAELLPSLPVTLLPGVLDPANASYPQQPIHTAVFPTSRNFAKNPRSNEPGWFDTVTNPWEGEVEGWRVLGTGGQNIDDVFKYVESDDRLGMMEAMCRWRCCAPTAPDTLCECPSPRKPLLVWYEADFLPGSYPFQDDDPFVLKDCPHLYFAGNQPEFGTKVIHGPEGQSVRLITVPSFAATKEIVLVDTETLEVSKVQISTG